MTHRIVLVIVYSVTGMFVVGEEALGRGLRTSLVWNDEGLSSDDVLENSK